MALRILHLEDNPADAELIEDTLKAHGLDCDVVRVHTGQGFLSALETDQFDLILSDNTLPSFSGRQALVTAKRICPDVPYIFVSGTIGEEAAIESLTNGATDYVLKQRLTRLVPAVRRAIADIEALRKRKQAERDLQRLAYCDFLTGLGNRTSLHDRMQQAMAGTGDKPGALALLILDLAGFTDINVTLGHQNGDRLLQEMAQRLRGALPTAVSIVRLGGDDFAVLLHGGTEEAAEHAQRILGAVKQPLLLEGLYLEVGGNIGVACYPDHAQDPSNLLRRAEVALSAAKNHESGYAVYSTDHDPYKPQRLMVVSELRHAIEDNQLVLYYQPKMSLETGKAVGVEALARWHHPDGRLVSPAQFVPLAEQTGLIKPLTLWALQEALRQSVAWRKEGLDIPVAVNLSTRNLLDASLPDRLADFLAASGTDPGKLCLEITESVVMADPLKSQAHLARLHRMGIRLAVDDFGTGYSSLAYLKRLPVHELKIDKAFVSGLMRDRNDAAIVRVATDLGRNLGLKVVAEGVEDQQTWHGLMALGCHEAQGFLISPPLPAADLTRWLQDPQPRMVKS